MDAETRAHWRTYFMRSLAAHSSRARPFYVGHTELDFTVARITMPRRHSDLHRFWASRLNQSSLTGGLRVASKSQKTYKERIKNFIERYWRPKSRKDLIAQIAEQHETMSCKICYDHKDSLFIKCKTCKSGEFHKLCMRKWCDHKQLKTQKCLLCSAEL
jgi:hypothetical protein